MQPKGKKRPDLRVSLHGSVAMVERPTRLGRRWFRDHVAFEAWQIMGEGVACEPRRLPDVIAGAQQAGLTVEVRP